MLINIAIIAIAKMYASVPFFVGALAPLAALGEVGQLSDVPRSGIDVDKPQHEFSVPKGSLSSGRAALKLTRGTVAIVSLLAVATVLVFVVFQCFRAMTSGKSNKNQGVTARRVAEGGRDSCSVSHHVETTAHTAASQVLPVPAAVSGSYGLNLRNFRHVSHGLLEMPKQTTCLFTNAGILHNRRYIAAQHTTPNTFTSRGHARRR